MWLLGLVIRTIAGPNYVVRIIDFLLYFKFRYPVPCKWIGTDGDNELSGSIKYGEVLNLPRTEKECAPCSK